MTPSPSTDTAVGAIAARLEDIATTVAQEASQLTILMRSVADHAQGVAALVADLEEAARRIDAGMQVSVRLGACGSFGRLALSCSRR